MSSGQYTVTVTAKTLEVIHKVCTAYLESDAGDLGQRMNASRLASAALGAMYNLPVGDRPEGLDAPRPWDGEDVAPTDEADIAEERLVN